MSLITDGFGTDVGGGIGGPGIPPTISGISPAAGTAITASTIISFDVLDDSGIFRRVLLAANFPNAGVYEIIHDGDSFGPQYSSPENSISAITGGYHFSVVRYDGWPASPLLRVFAIDREGLEG